MKKGIPELSILASSLLFSIAAVLVKVLTGKFDAYFVALFRFLTGIVLCALIILMTRKGFKIYEKKLVIWRSIYGGIAMVLYYVSIQMSSSGRATLLNTTYPVFVVIFSALFFKEKLRLMQVISVLVCLAGVALVFYDGSSYSIWGDLIGILSAVAAALAMHYMKKAREKNNSFTIYLSVCIAGLLGSFFSFPQFGRLDWTSAGLLVLSGAIMFGGQIFLTYGIKFISTARGSILSFSKILFTILLSLLIGEVIKTRFIIGTGLILTGLFLNRD